MLFSSYTYETEMMHIDKFVIRGDLIMRNLNDLQINTERLTLDTSDCWSDH